MTKHTHYTLMDSGSRGSDRRRQNRYSNKHIFIYSAEYVFICGPNSFSPGSDHIVLAPLLLIPYIP